MSNIPVNDPSYNPGIKSKKRSWLKIIGLIIVAFIVMIAVFVTFVFSITDAPAKEAENFVTLLSTNQLDEAYTSTSIMFRDVISRDNLDVYVEEFSILSPGAEVSFNYRSIDNDLARVRGTITSAKGEKSPIEVMLVNENGEWKVLSINLLPAPLEESTMDFDDDF